LPNLALSTTWQTINFNGSESLDINTFGIDPISGLKFLLIILLLKLSTTMVNMIVTFFTSFQFTTTTTLLTVRTTLQMRFLLPNGTSAG
jgi:hypothetical protein